MAKGSGNKGFNMTIDVTDHIGPVLDLAVALTVERIAKAAEEGARDLESYARANAPWTDRTGDARNGLTAEVEVDGFDVVIDLYHTVDYGIWLELKNDGEYAIILPTIEALGPEILHNMGGKAFEVDGPEGF